MTWTPSGLIVTIGNQNFLLPAHMNVAAMGNYLNELRSWYA